MTGKLLLTDKLRVTSTKRLFLKDHEYRRELELISREHQKKPEILVVHPLPLEEYLVGIVSSEVPASWPMEALKARLSQPMLSHFGKNTNASICLITWRPVFWTRSIRGQTERIRYRSKSSSENLRRDFDASSSPDSRLFSFHLRQSHGKCSRGLGYAAQLSSWK